MILSCHALLHCRSSRKCALKTRPAAWTMTDMQPLGREQASCFSVNCMGAGSGRTPFYSTRQEQSLVRAQGLTVPMRSL